MSKAFYPTNDGHIGNLQNLSTREVLDLLKRQEDLLKKKGSLLNKLPDKGERVKRHSENLREEIKRRETLSTTDVSVVSSQAKENKEQKQKRTDTEKFSQKDLKKEKFLECDLKQLSIDDSAQDVTKSVDLEDSVSNEKVKHQFEVAIERAEKNVLSGKKQPIKLNRALKIEHVKDLPEEITKMKCPKTQIKDEKQSNKMECNRVIEESAAVPPCYRFNEAKLVDLNESLQLQQQQKQLQEELNAQLAAEKLAERLHIKMETYNPEGVDMSYRKSRGGQFADDIDSDDEVEDENVDLAGYSRSLVPSDTED